jgi:hypothetical protein
MVLCFIVALEFVAAAPPFEATTQAGALEILSPTWEYIPQNTKIDFYWHVFNSTNILNGTRVTCAFHLYSKNLNGEHIYVNNNVTTYSNNRDFEVPITAGNFSTAGDYCYLVECYTGSQAGGIERCFQVTSKGESLNGYDSTVYIALEIGLFALLVFFGVMAWLFKNVNMKNLFVCLGLGSLILMAQIAHTSVINHPSLSNVTLAGVVLSIITFMFVVSIMLIKYTIYTIKLLKGDRENLSL